MKDRNENSGVENSFEYATKEYIRDDEAVAYSKEPELPISSIQEELKVPEVPVNSIQEDVSPTHFHVAIKNACSYPVRVLVYMDENTGHGTYSVFRQFERRELTINLLTFRHLQKDPKVRLTRIEN